MTNTEIIFLLSLIVVGAWAVKATAVAQKVKHERNILLFRLFDAKECWDDRRVMGNHAGWFTLTPEKSERMTAILTAVDAEWEDVDEFN